MNLKEMLMEAAELQAETIKDQMMDKLRSKEMAEMIATKINEKIDIKSKKIQIPLLTPFKLS